MLHQNAVVPEMPPSETALKSSIIHVLCQTSSLCQSIATESAGIVLRFARCRPVASDMYTCMHYLRQPAVALNQW